MCVTNTTGRRPQALSFGANVTTLTSSPQSYASPNGVPSKNAAKCSDRIHEFVASSSSSSSSGSSAASSRVPSPTFPAHFTVQSEEERKSLRPKRKRRPQQPGLTAKNQERHFVHHNYHDHACDDPGTSGDSTIGTASSNSDQCRRRRGASTSFPLKLHTMLNQIEADGLAHVISWQPHGRCFVIHKPKEFVDSVMPKYFRQSKLTSFQRQLNLYGFQRLTRGPDERGYYHELFLRGKTFLCNKMTRTKVKGTKFKAASSPEQEPDFYKMLPVLVTPEPSDASDHDNSSVHSSEMHTRFDSNEILPIIQDASPSDSEPFSSKFSILLAEALTEEKTPSVDPEPVEIESFRHSMIPMETLSADTNTLASQGFGIYASNNSNQPSDLLSVDAFDDSDSLIGDIMEMWYPENKGFYATEEEEVEPSISLENDSKFGQLLEMLLNE